MTLREYLIDALCCNTEMKRKVRSVWLEGNSASGRVVIGIRLGDMHAEEQYLFDFKVTHNICGDDVEQVMLCDNTEILWQTNMKYGPQRFNDIYKELLDIAKRNERIYVTEQLASWLKYECYVNPLPEYSRKFLQFVYMCADRCVRYLFGTV